MKNTENTLDEIKNKELNIQLLNMVKESNSFEKDYNNIFNLINQLKNNITIVDNRNILTELILAQKLENETLIRNVLEVVEKNNKLFDDPLLWKSFNENKFNFSYVHFVFVKKLQNKLLENNEGYLKNIVEKVKKFEFTTILEYCNIEYEMCKIKNEENLLFKLIEKDKFLFDEYLRKYKNLMIVDGMNLFTKIITMDMLKYKKETYIDSIIQHCPENSECFKDKESISNAIKASNLTNQYKNYILKKLNIKKPNLIQKIISIRNNKKENNKGNTFIIIVSDMIKNLFERDIYAEKVDKFEHVNNYLKKHENYNQELKKEIIEYISYINELKNEKLTRNLFEKELSIIDSHLKQILILNKKKEILKKVSDNKNIENEMKNIEQENIILINLIKHFKESIYNELMKDINKDLKISKKLTYN